MEVINISNEDFFDKETAMIAKVYTYNEILDTVKALKEVKDTGIVNMLTLNNVIDMLTGFGYEKEAYLITSIKKGFKFSLKYYHLLLKLTYDIEIISK